MAPFLARLPQSRTIRVPGMAVFLTGNPDYVPTSLLHNLKHNKVLHERVLFVTVQNVDEPEVAADRRTEVSELAPGIHRVMLRYGFMESPNIPRALEDLNAAGVAVRPDAGQLLPRPRGAGAGDGAEDALVAALAVPGAGAQRGAGDRVLPHPVRPRGGTRRARRDLTGATRNRDDGVTRRLIQGARETRRRSAGRCAHRRSVWLPEGRRTCVNSDQRIT